MLNWHNVRSDDQNGSQTYINRYRYLEVSAILRMRINIWKADRIFKDNIKQAKEIFYFLALIVKFGYSYLLLFVLFCHKRFLKLSKIKHMSANSFPNCICFTYVFMILCFKNIKICIIYVNSAKIMIFYFIFWNKATSNCHSFGLQFLTPFKLTKCIYYIMFYFMTFNRIFSSFTLLIKFNFTSKFSEALN